jgi:hypothetical protein
MMADTVPVPDKETVFHMFFADISPEGDAGQLVKRLDDRIQGILQEGVDRFFQPLDTIEKQLEMCYFNAWGEIRSVDTFARQIMGLGANHVELKRGLCRQIHEEIEHFKLYRECGLRMGGVDMMTLAPPRASIEMFDYCDAVSPDSLESVLSCQFCTEKGAVVWFKAALAKSPNMHPDFKAVIEQIMPDEYFHVSNGRAAALILANQGEEKRVRLVRLCSDAVWFTMQNIVQGSMIVV